MTRRGALINFNAMRKKPELPDVEPVRLRPVFGIRPGIIILSALAGAAILILFLFLVLPGLMQDGGYVRFSLNTADTAVYAEDGRYIGSSEGSVYYLPHGENTFRFSIEGIDAGSITVDIPHRIFFTLFSHRITEIEYSIANTPEIEEAVKEGFARDISAWSEVINYDEAYHYPPLFTSFARNAVALGFSDVSDEILYGALHVTSDEMRSDLDEALGILSASSVRYESPELGTVTASFTGEIPVESSGNRSVGKPVKEGRFFSYDPLVITIGDNGSSVFPEANERMADTEVPAFSIASRPVSEYEYALFVEENPYWSSANKENLIKDGMVDDGYLDGIALSTRVESTVPIRNISYNAAEAYAGWLSEKDGKSYMIPSEAEWTAAALSAEGKRYATSLVSIDTDGSSPSFMMGQLWEMTRTPYIPLSRLAYDRAMEVGGLYPYDDIIVKGGSYINDPASITVDTVGAMDRARTSEYATFRIGMER